MNHQCIMCEQPAGSREHVFPAAFGGRRVDKRIYCDAHNKALGVHVTALLEAFAFLNALLGVRSDHRDAATPYVLESTSGDRYQVLRDKVEVAPPRALSETPDLVGKSIPLKFSGLAARDRWAAAQRKEGFGLKYGAVGGEQTQYFTEPLHVSPRFGTEPFMRAVAYLALTYLAHSFPDVARQPGLAGIKAYVLGGDAQVRRVWWMSPDMAASRSDGADRIEHVVSVGLDAESGQASASVTFFGALTLAADLGPVHVEQTQVVRTRIDPLVERPGPDDIEVTSIAGSKLELGSPDAGVAYLQSVVSGQATNPIGRLVARLQASHLDRSVEQVFDELTAAAVLPDVERDAIVRAAVAREGQRVFNLLSWGISDFLTQSQDFPEPLKKAIADCIAADPTSDSGLSDSATQALILAKESIAQELVKHLDQGTLTQAELKFLLAGGTGFAAALPPVLYAVLGLSPDGRSLSTG